MKKTCLCVVLSILANLLGGATGWAQNQADGKKLYLTYCSGCHGESGKGNGTAAASLPVRPSDHTNGAVMNELSDKYLMDIISKGGSGVGKSTFMPAWGGALDEKQIRDVIAYIRSIAVPPFSQHQLH